MFDWSLALPTLTLAVGGLSILLGLVVVRENPRHRLNWVLALMLILGGIGAVFGAGDFAISREEPKLLKDQAGLLGSSAAIWEFIFPTFLLFALLFPSPRAIVRRFPAVEWIVFLPHVVHLVFALIGPPGTDGWSLQGLSAALPALAPLLDQLELAAGLMFQLNVALFSLVNVSYMVLAIALLRAVLLGPVHDRLRLQIRVMMAGMGGCFALYTVAAPIPALLGLRVAPVVRTGLIVAGLALASLSVAYAIVRHRFLDAKIIARRTILYGVSSGVLLGLYLFGVHGLHLPVSSFFSIDPQVVEIAFLVVALMIFQPAAGRLEEWLETVFLRDPSDRRTVLRELAQEVSTVLDLDELGQRVIRMLETSLMVERAALLVRRAPDRPLEFVSSFGIDDAPGPWMQALADADFAGVELPCLEELVAGADEHLAPSLGRMSVVPLMHGNQLQGGLMLGAKPTGGSFNSEERLLLGALGTQMGMAIRNAQLHEESIGRRLLEEELRFARRVQQSFLPAAMPSYPPLHVAALNLPSKMVGGDYVDALPLGTDELLVAIGDVSGKGVPAALLMSMTRAALRTQALSQHSPGEILRSMNALIHESTSPREFVTFFLGCIDRAHLKLRYSNGGHDRPLLRRADGHVEWLTDGGLLLGAVPDATFEEGEVGLHAGDLLVLYTDGLTEAEREGEMFGIERLERLVSGLGPELSANEVLERLVATCREWTGGREPEDDMTLLVVRVDGRATAPHVGAGTAAAEVADLVQEPVAGTATAAGSDLQ